MTKWIPEPPFRDLVHAIGLAKRRAALNGKPVAVCVGVMSWPNKSLTKYYYTKDASNAATWALNRRQKTKVIVRPDGTSYTLGVSKPNPEHGAAGEPEEGQVL